MAYEDYRRLEFKNVVVAGFMPAFNGKLPFDIGHLTRAKARAYEQISGIISRS